jgi:hypothetical protein
LAHFERQPLSWLAASATALKDERWIMMALYFGPQDLLDPEWSMRSKNIIQVQVSSPATQDRRFHGINLGRFSGL